MIARSNECNRRRYSYAAYCPFIWPFGQLYFFIPRIFQNFFVLFNFLCSLSSNERSSNIVAQHSLASGPTFKHPVKVTFYCLIWVLHVYHQVSFCSELHPDQLLHCSRQSFSLVVVFRHVIIELFAFVFAQTFYLLCSWNAGGTVTVTDSCTVRDSLFPLSHSFSQKAFYLYAHRIFNASTQFLAYFFFRLWLIIYLAHFFSIEYIPVLNLVWCLRFQH